eukprot:GHRR01008297.1.p1 GENE.GHRR01008297.1~~GHRR01008297.1.p1  ORF type:complete len:338 (+),score=146.04 GHRR01008297.1:547-1560(+)
MGRAGGWEFFVTRWQMFAVAFSNVVHSAKQTVPQVSAVEAAKINVVLKKAVRARQLLQQLQDFGQRQEQLELRYRPVVQQLPSLQQQLHPGELSQAAEFAVSEGMRQPILQVTGKSAAAVSAAEVSDPFGIRVAFRPGHPLALLTWKQYIAIVSRVSRTVEQQLQGPCLDALSAFNRERKLLVQELQALKQQLHEHVEIPQLQPLRDETERLDQMKQSLQQLQAAHLAMLRKDMAQLDLQLLEVKLKLQDTDSYKGSQLQAALRRLKHLQQQVREGASWFPAKVWGQLDEDLKIVISHVQQRQKLEQQVDANLQRYEQMMFRRLSQLQQPQEALQHR